MQGGRVGVVDTDLELLEGKDLPGVSFLSEK
jgi:hypothetical protein